MDQKPKRPARPVKPKNVEAVPVPATPSTPTPSTPTPSTPTPSTPTPSTPTPSTPTPATPAVVASTTAPAATPTLSPASAVLQKSRTQTNKAIGVSISAARVRRHLDKLNLNSTIDSMITQIKDQLNAFRTAKAQLESGKKMVTVETTLADGKKRSVEELVDLTAEDRAAAKVVVDKLSPSVSEFEMKAAALSRERTRFSNEASITLSIICDELIQQLVDHTMNRVLAAKKKIIQISHLHESGVEKLSLYPLIQSLPSFTTTASRLALECRDSTHGAQIAQLLAQAEKDFKKKYAVHLPKKKNVAVALADAADLQPAGSAVPDALAAVAEPEVAEPEETEDDESTDSKTSFRFYVHQVCKALVLREPRYKAVRVSTEIRGYLSDLLVELIQRLSGLVLLTASNMKNKTINDVAILRTVESLLIDNHTSTESVEFREAQVPDPVVLKAETAKRDEEKKAGREYKIDPSKVPTVRGLVAVRAVSYPMSGYAVLAAKVAEKLALYESLSEKDKDAAAGVEASA